MVATAAFGLAFGHAVVPAGATGRLSEAVGTVTAVPGRAGLVTLARPGALLGDFDRMRQRRIVRVLTPFGQTDFFFDRGRPLGVNAEFAAALETFVNRRHARGHLRIQVAMVPVPRHRLIPALLEGLGDIVMGNLTVTPGRESQVDFAKPRLTDVSEVVVTGPQSPVLNSLDDLAGRTVPVTPSSSYATHLAALSADLEKRGLAPIRIGSLPPDLEDEQILSMVASGLLPMAVVDDHRGRLWADILPALTVRDDLVVHRGGRIAWAIRKGSPLLKAELDAFLDLHRQGTAFGNTIHRRYFRGAGAPRGATVASELRRYQTFADSFRRHGIAVGIDPLLLAAQGYQESQLRQDRRSHRGAVGVMQLLPRTAAAPPVSVPDVASSADSNIRAGALYMRHLMDTYVNDPALDQVNRALLTFAAYNAGPGNLRRFRREAKRLGLDANAWMNNVEIAAAKIVGRETVQYVSNIYKYYLAYRFAFDLARAAGPAAPPVGLHARHLVLDPTCLRTVASQGAVLGCAQSHRRE